MTRSIKAKVKPSLLRWARTTAGLSLEAAATRAKISPERLRGWEEEQAAPSVAQLRNLAVVYRRPLAAFFLPEPPAVPEPIPDYRAARGEVLGPSPALLFDIRKCRDRREVALDLFTELEEEPPRFEFRLRYGTDPEEAGAAVCSALRVSMKERSGWRGAYAAFNGWRRSVEAVGALVFQVRGVPFQEVRGFSIDDEPLPVIAVNSKDAVYGRVFTMLHELVHLAIGSSGLCDLDDEPAGHQAATETYCNRVAGAAAVPRTELLQHPLVAGTRKTRHWSDDEIKRLSNDFGASREAVVRRLMDLGFASKAEYQDKRDLYLREYLDYLKNRGSTPVPPHRLSLASAGPTFTQLVLDAFGQDRITASEAADYLAVRVKRVEEIQRDVRKRGLMAIAEEAVS